MLLRASQQQIGTLFPVGLVVRIFFLLPFCLLYKVELLFEGSKFFKVRNENHTQLVISLVN